MSHDPSNPFAPTETFVPEFEGQRKPWKPWSHTFAQSIAGEFSSDGAEAREILSRCYCNDFVLVLPISSGRFAIFDHTRQLITLLDDAPTATELRDLSAEAGKRLHVIRPSMNNDERESPRKATASATANISTSLDDL